MADDQFDDEPILDAGEFSPWMEQMQAALRGERASDVPCGGCTACCTSSQFVHVEPDEADTLAHIPADLLFPAPRLPFGHVLLGYDERGHCPLLVDNHCSIYEHRPRTCRTYDCRVLPAAGLEGDDDKVLIARQARRWRFSFATQDDHIRHDAVRAAATFVDEHRDSLPVAAVPTTATQTAVLAIQIHHRFLSGGEATDHSSVIPPDPDVMRAEVVRVTGAPDRAEARWSGPKPEWR
ncbi:MAG TPA: YkgJ family cysteine cluster protein [Acidimicrobiales bacterium]|nr:YkgJ family cysteine cluster protein [Acidimicrobiales bacterium]